MPLRANNNPEKPIRWVVFRLFRAAHFARWGEIDRKANVKFEP
jgi:hypothetical protein